MPVISQDSLRDTSMLIDMKHHAFAAARRIISHELFDDECEEVSVTAEEEEIQGALLGGILLF
jgi:hypothetical protein